MSTGPVVLRARGVTKRFGSVAALDGVDVELRRGESLALLGPNGAGKTTLMRIIAGLLEPDDGTLSWTAADDATTPPPIGLVPQEIALYDALTARENLEVFGGLHRVRGARLARRVAWALDWTGLEARRDDPVRTFSGGMRRRLNIACGVLHDPPVVLLDEPTVGVDPQSRFRIRDMLAGLRRDGASLLHSSHHLEEIEASDDRVVILDRGRVIASGASRDVAVDTLRCARTLHVTLDRAIAPTALGGDYEVDGHRIRGPIEDVASEIPDVLDRIARCGATVLDLQVRTPTLEETFTRLTGTGLRE